ncbi:MAG: ATP-binding protein [Desulfovibrionaceae bacterium]
MTSKKEKKPAPSASPAQTDSPAESNPPAESSRQADVQADAQARLDARLRAEGAVAACASLLLVDEGGDAIPKMLATLRLGTAARRAWFLDVRRDPDGPYQLRVRAQACAQDAPPRPWDATGGYVSAHAVGLPEAWLAAWAAGESVRGVDRDLGADPALFFAVHGAAELLLAPVRAEEGLAAVLGLEWTDADAGQDAAPGVMAVAAMAGAWLRRARSEEAELLREMRLGVLVQLMPVMIHAFDARGNIIFWNRECERVTGYMADEVLDNPGAMRLLYPDPTFRAAIIEHWQERGGDYRQSEWPVRCKDGSERRIAWANTSKLYPIPGWATWAAGVDVTERSHAEHRIIAAKKEWESTFDSVPDCVLLLDADGRVRRLNMAAAERLGVHPKYAVGKALGRLLRLPDAPPDALGDGSGVRAGSTVDAAPDPAAAILDMARAEATSAREMDIAILGGHFLVTVTPFAPDGERTGSIVIAHDISRRLMLEEQLSLARKLEALGTLAGGIAHDFNNILGTILGYAEMAGDTVDPESPAARMLASIRKAGSRARDLVEQVLAFSRQDREEPRLVHLNGAVRDSMGLIEASLPAQVTARLHLDADDDAVTMDPTRLHQVLMNLCLNAAQAMGEKGGLLEVVLDNVLVEREEAGASPPLAPGEYVRLGVADTGEGMDPDMLDRIFEPFFTTKKPGEGTGMGLAVVHGAVKRCGGAIAVRSAPGQGTAMQVFFPVADTGELDLREPPRAQGTQRVLVIDPAPDVQAVADALAALDFEVARHATAAEALEVFAAAPGEYDCVMIAATLPDMGGLACAAAVKGLRPGMAVVLCTRFHESVLLSRAREAGVDACLPLPAPPLRLARCVRRAMGRD